MQLPGSAHTSVIWPAKSCPLAYQARTDNGTPSIGLQGREDFCSGAQP